MCILSFSVNIISSASTGFHWSVSLSLTSAALVWLSLAPYWQFSQGARGLHGARWSVCSSSPSWLHPLGALVKIYRLLLQSQVICLNTCSFVEHIKLWFYFSCFIMFLWLLLYVSAILCVQRFVGIRSTGSCWSVIMVLACFTSWVFGVVFGIVPVIYDWIKWVKRGKKDVFSWISTKRTEMLLLSSIILQLH